MSASKLNREQRQERDQRILDLCAVGRTKREIAEELGLHFDLVHTVIKRAKQGRTPEKVREDVPAGPDNAARDARIAELHAQRKSLWEIVNLLLQEGLLEPAENDAERKQRWNMVRSTIRRAKAALQVKASQEEVQDVETLAGETAATEGPPPLESLAGAEDAPTLSEPTAQAAPATADPAEGEEADPAAETLPVATAPEATALVEAAHLPSMTLGQIQAASLDDLARWANGEHEKVKDAYRRCLESARIIGQLLLEAKERTAHGQWRSWLTDHVSFSERTAQNYMRLAERWDEVASKSAVSADLTIDSAIRLLAAPRPASASSLPSEQADGTELAPDIVDQTVIDVAPVAPCDTADEPAEEPPAPKEEVVPEQPAVQGIRQPKKRREDIPHVKPAAEDTSHATADASTEVPPSPQEDTPAEQSAPDSPAAAPETPHDEPKSSYTQGELFDAPPTPGAYSTVQVASAPTPESAPAVSAVEEPPPVQSTTAKDRQQGVWGIYAMRKTVKKLSAGWTTAEDREAVRQCLREMADEI